MVGRVRAVASAFTFSRRNEPSYGLTPPLSGSMQGAGGVGGLLGMRDGNNGTNYFCAYDGNGNVAGFVNANNGLLSAQYEYDPFGNVLRATGYLSQTNTVRFSSKMQDPESGWSYYGYRYYNPSGGRWVSRDPIEEKGGLNVYGFVKNGPIGGIDSVGLKAEMPLNLDFPSTLVPDPNKPGSYILKRSGKYKIGKCRYVVLVGHGRHQPAVMDGGSCGLGAAYGCYTGGGTYDNPNPDESSRILPSRVTVPPVVSPGIPGAPPQSNDDEGIDAEDLVAAVNAAFDAAVRDAGNNLCKGKCGCKKVTVEIVCTGPREPEMASLCGRKKIILCDHK
jgi:RHS repeat-associated protein